MSIDRDRTRTTRRQAGISFIELVLFILVVSIAVVGVLSVMNLTSSRSADPLVIKQATAIAESLLEEIELQPFTYCDPEDPKVSDTTITEGNAATQCAIPEVFGTSGSESGQTRTTYNNVNDYVSANGVETGPLAIIDVSESDTATVPGLDAYQAYVTITQQSIGGVSASDSLRIDVRVTGPGGTNVKLTGYRLRYAPYAG